MMKTKYITIYDHIALLPEDLLNKFKKSIADLETSTVSSIYTNHIESILRSNIDSIIPSALEILEDNAINTSYKLSKNIAMIIDLFIRVKILKEGFWKLIIERLLCNEIILNIKREEPSIYDED